MSAGKGDGIRPYNPETFGKNYDNIFRKKDREMTSDKLESQSVGKPLEYTIVENKTSEGYVKVKKRVCQLPETSKRPSRGSPEELDTQHDPR